MTIKNLKYSFILNGNEIGDPTQSGSGYVLEGTKICRDRKGSSGNTADIFVSDDLFTDYSIIEGQEIVISRGETTAYEQYIFRGNYKKSDIKDNRIILRCRDPLQKLKYDLFTYSYDKNIDSEAGEISAIFTDIAEDGGFTVSAVSTGTATTDIVLDKYISKDNTRLNRLDILAKIVNYFFYYDYDNSRIRFEPKGYETYTSPLIVGSNIYNTPKWIVDIEPMRNKIKVEGAYELDTREDTDTGDGIETTFEFTYTPETTDCTVNGVLQVRGIVGEPGAYDYTVDRENKTYTFAVAPTNTHAIVMGYTTKLLMPVTDSSSTSIAKYGLTQEEKFKFKDIVTVDDAEKRIEQLLELLKDGVTNTTLETDEYDIKPGMKVDVEDPIRTFRNGNYIVSSVITNYPHPLEIVKVGSNEINISTILQTIDERIKAIVGDDYSLSEILRQIVSLFHTYTYRRYSIETEMKVTGAAIYGHPSLGIYGSSTYGDDTSFTLGHPTYGVLGTSSLGDQGSAWVETYERIY